MSIKAHHGIVICNSDDHLKEFIDTKRKGKGKSVSIQSLRVGTGNENVEQRSSEGFSLLDSTTEFSRHPPKSSRTHHYRFIPRQPGAAPITHLGGESFYLTHRAECVFNDLHKLDNLSSAIHTSRSFCTCMTEYQIDKAFALEIQERDLTMEAYQIVLAIEQTYGIKAVENDDDLMEIIYRYESCVNLYRVLAEIDSENSAQMYANVIATECQMFQDNCTDLCNESCEDSNRASMDLTPSRFATDGSETPNALLTTPTKTVSRTSLFHKLKSAKPSTKSIDTTLLTGSLTSSPMNRSICNGPSNIPPTHSNYLRLRPQRFPTAPLASPNAYRTDMQTFSETIEASGGGRTRRGRTSSQEDRTNQPNSGVRSVSNITHQSATRLTNSEMKKDKSNADKSENPRRMSVAGSTDNKRLAAKKQPTASLEQGQVNTQSKSLQASASFGPLPAVPEEKWLKICDEGLTCKVWYKSFPSSTALFFRLEGLIEASLLDVLAVMAEVDYTTKWVPFVSFPFRLGLANISCIARNGRFDKVSLYEVAMPWPFKNRTSCVHGWMVDDLERNNCLSFAYRTLDPDSDVLFCPITTIPSGPPNTIRVQFDGGATITPSANSCYLRMVCLIDPKEKFNTTLINFFAGRFMKLAFNAFRKQCIDVHKVQNHTLQKVREDDKWLYGYVESRLQDLKQFSGDAAV